MIFVLIYFGRGPGGAAGAGAGWPSQKRVLSLDATWPGPFLMGASLPCPVPSTTTPFRAGWNREPWFPFWGNSKMNTHVILFVASTRAFACHDRRLIRLLYSLKICSKAQRLYPSNRITALGVFAWVRFFPKT